VRLFSPLALATVDGLNAVGATRTQDLSRPHRNPATDFEQERSFVVAIALSRWHLRHTGERCRRTSPRLTSALSIEAAVGRLLERGQRAAQRLPVADGRAVSHYYVGLTERLDQHCADQRGRCRTCRTWWGRHVATPCVPLRDLHAAITRELPTEWDLAS
jgi:hypothetical protein